MTITTPDSNNFSISLAVPSDAPEILALQRLAFRSEAAIYGVDDIPPLTQTLDELEADFEKYTFLKAVHGARIVGSVKARMSGGHQNRTAAARGGDKMSDRITEGCYVGRLIVHPDCQNQGLGTRLMHAIEAAFPDVERFWLETGSRSVRNLHLYAKLGYRPYAEKQVNDKVTLVFMEKKMRRGGPSDARSAEPR